MHCYSTYGSEVLPRMKETLERITDEHFGEDVDEPFLHVEEDPEHGHPYETTEYDPFNALHVPSH